MMDERYYDDYEDMQNGDFTYYEEVPDDLHDKYPYLGDYKQTCEGQRIALVRNRDGKWGYLKADGDMLISCSHDSKEEAEKALHEFSSNVVTL